MPPQKWHDHNMRSMYLSLVSFDVVGYGCMTCIGNSGPLPETVVEAITQVNTEYLTCNCTASLQVCIEYDAMWTFLFSGRSGSSRYSFWEQELRRSCTPQHPCQLLSFSSSGHCLCYCRNNKDWLWNRAHWWVKSEYVCVCHFNNQVFSYMSPSVSEVKSVGSVWCVCWNSGEPWGEGNFSKGHLAHKRGDPGCGKEVCYPRHVQRGLWESGG